MPWVQLGYARVPMGRSCRGKNAALAVMEKKTAPVMKVLGKRIDPKSPARASHPNKSSEGGDEKPAELCGEWAGNDPLQDKR